MSNDCVLVGNKVIVEDATLKGRLVEKGFGENKTKTLILDLFEAVFLVESNKIRVLDKKKSLSSTKLVGIGLNFDKKFYSKCVVYSDLREKGIVIKTGLKFGFDFRLYPKGKKMGEAHSEYGLNVFDENEKVSMTQISRVTRLAGNINIKSITAVVDREDEVNYYLLERRVF